MEEIIWTAEAERWLNDIYEYIALDDVEKAAEVVDGIYKRAQVLKDHPKIGYKYREEPEGEIRILLYGHYRIAYLSSDDNNIIILGVFHGSLDIERYF